MRPDSLMRRPISRATRQTRSATTGVCEPSPQCGVTSAVARNRSRSAPAPHQLVPQVGELAPVALRRGEHRTVGGHDAPRHPAAADEEPVEVAGDPGEAGVHRDRQHVGSGGEQRGDVGGGAAVHADGRHARHRRHRARQHVDRRVGGDREARFHQVAEPRLVDEDDLWALRQRGRRLPTEIAATCERTARAATAKATSSGTPARTSATPSVTGPTNCHLIGWS